MFLKPKTDILPEAQQELFPLLREIPKNFVLYGGTAVALRYGHRQSIDFDFFTSKQDINLKETALTIPFMQKINEEGNLSYMKYSDNHVDFVLLLPQGSVQLSFLNNRDLMPGAVNTPDILQGNNLKIASPIDLMAAKILALHNRTNAKDFFDMAELINRGISLQKGYEAAFAIAKLSPLRTSQLMLDRLNSEFQSKTVEKILLESDLPVISEKAKECSSVLKKAAGEVQIDRVCKTHQKADKNLEKSIGLSLGRGL